MDSHVGIDGAESMRCNGQYWDEALGFPKKSFY